MEFLCHKAVGFFLAAVVLVIMLKVYETNNGVLSRSSNVRKSVSPLNSDQIGSVARITTARSFEEDVILRLFEMVPYNQIWKPFNVSEQTPFVFMHQRKAGGTSLRSTLHVAARTSNLTSFIPCFGGVDCRVFTIPMTPAYAVYALHTTWSELERLVCVKMQNITAVTANNRLPLVENVWRDDVEDDNGDEKGSDFPSDDTLIYPTRVPTVAHMVDTAASSSEAPFACLTNFREPVSRLISCLYFRFHRYLQHRNLSCINDLSVARMTRLLVEKLDSYNNSCLNEPFRVLGPFDEERVVTSLGYHYNNVTYEVSARHGELELNTLNATLHNLQRCVPVVLELPHSYRLLKTAFPSLHKMNAFDHKVREQSAYNHSANCTVPTTAHLHVLKQLTSFENLLYRAVVKKVHSALNDMEKSVFDSK